MNKLRFPVSLASVSLLMWAVFPSLCWGEAIPVTIKSFSVDGVSEVHSYQIVDADAAPGPGSVMIDYSESEAHESTHILMLRPGRSYSVDATLPCLSENPACSYSGDDRIIQMVFEAPDGYRVYLDTWESSVYDFYAPGGNFMLRVEAESPLRLGEASRPLLKRGHAEPHETPPAELWMGFGVGRVFTGRGLGPLRLRADLSDGVDPVLETENMYFSRPYGVWYYVSSSTSVRQIKKHDVVVDVRKSGDDLLVRYFKSSETLGTVESDGSSMHLFNAQTGALSEPFITHRIEKVGPWELRITAEGEATGAYRVYRDGSEPGDWTVERLDVQNPAGNDFEYISSARTTVSGVSYPDIVWEDREVIYKGELDHSSFTAIQSFTQNNGNYSGVTRVYEQNNGLFWSASSSAS